MSNADYKIKYVEPSRRHALALESQTFLPVTFNSTRYLVEPDQNIFVLNAVNEANRERNATTKYRIQGKVQLLTDNTIRNAWSSTPIPDTAWSPSTEIGELAPDYTPNNWLFTITYPFENDNIKEIVSAGKRVVVNYSTAIPPQAPTVDVSDFITKAYEGFQIIELLPINYKNGITNILVRSSQKHGFTNTDDYLYLSPKNNLLPLGIDTNNYLGFHKVLDFEPGNEDFGLILDTEYIPETQNPQGGDSVEQNFLGVGKRVFDTSYDDTSFSNPVTVTQIQAVDFSGGTGGTNPDNRNHTKIYSPSHSLRVNDFIEIRTSESTNRDIVNIFKVKATPSLDTFIIEYDLNIGINPINFTLKYIFLDGVPSEYYYRKNKILTGPKDYDAYKAAYAINLFNEDDFINQVYLFHYDKDIDVGGLRDNLNRPISELYLTIVKRAGNGCTEQNDCGEDYPGFSNFTTNYQILENNIKFTPVNNGSQPVVMDVLSFWQNNDPTTSGTYKSGNAIYYNDFVEYNRAFLNEVTLADTFASFGPTQVLFNPNYNPNTNSPQYIYDKVDGYTTKIHYKIKIRDYSSNIETAVNRTTEIYPEYAQVNNDGTVSWRDLLPIGFIQNDDVTVRGVNYPFVNGKHYLFGEYPIYIRRQLGISFVQEDFNDRQFVKFNTNNPNDEC